MTSGGEGLAPREGGEMTQSSPQPCGAGSMVHSSMGAPGKGPEHTGSTVGLVLPAGCRPALTFLFSWLLCPLTLYRSSCPLFPSWVPTSSSSFSSPFTSARGGGGRRGASDLLSPSLLPCSEGSGGGGWSQVLVASSYTEGRWVGDMSDPGEGTAQGLEG